jgi:hypothetical protein
MDLVHGFSGPWSRACTRHAGVSSVLAGLLTFRDEVARGTRRHRFQAVSCARIDAT